MDESIIASISTVADAEKSGAFHYLIPKIADNPTTNYQKKVSSEVNNSKHNDLS